jgi:Amt family ammonium transporter
VGVWGIFAVLLSDADATFMGQLVGMLTIFVWVFVTSLSQVQGEAKDVLDVVGHGQ